MNNGKKLSIPWRFIVAEVIVIAIALYFGANYKLSTGISIVIAGTIASLFIELTPDMIRFAWDKWRWSWPVWLTIIVVTGAIWLMGGWLQIGGSYVDELNRNFDYISITRSGGVVDTYILQDNGEIGIVNSASHFEAIGFIRGTALSVRGSNSTVLALKVLYGLPVLALGPDGILLVEFHE